MERATISQVKNQLSAYLKKVQAGETVLILDRERPVARLEGIRSAEHSDGVLARLERDGLIQRGSKPLPMDLLRNSPPAAEQSVLEALLAEREESM